MGITNEQYDALMRVYEKRRTDNHHVEEERRRIAREAVPELTELDRAVASLSAQHVKSRLQKDTEKEGGISKAPSFSELLRKAGGGMMPDEKRKLILKEHSFPADYLEPVYTCPLCRDTGWIDGRHCSCFDREVVRLFYTQSGLREVLERENFDTFDLSYYPEDLKDPKSAKSARQIMTQALATCRRFASGYGQTPEKDFLLLSGATGLGKTFLTHCIAKELIDNSHSVIYYSAGELFDKMADRKFQRDPETDTDLPGDEYLTGCDLLIIDDLGTELVNSFVGSAFFQLLNARISKGRGIVISTNLSPREIGQIYSDRISSRITEHFTLIRVFGEDIRIRKRLRQSGR